MAASNLQMSWTVTSITPAAGTALTGFEVTDVEVLEDEVLEQWQADGNPFPTLTVAAKAMRGVTIRAGNIAKMLAIPRNTACTIVAVLNDATNGAGSGAQTHTWINAFRQGKPFSGKTNKFAEGSVTFLCHSADGTTDPHSVVVAP